MQLHGKTFAYTAIANRAQIRNQDDVSEGEMFYVAYTKDGASPSTRPILFGFNGGPGSASLWLHLGTFGPRRVELTDKGELPKPPFKLVDNQETWIENADVVMVDAPGTGLSRVPEANAAKFYGQQSDLRAFSEFIKGYLVRTNRMTSPVYVAGESYGGFRVAGLSSLLLNQGVALSGIISISGTMNFSTLDAGKGNDLPYITFLPTFAATAFYHHKLNARLSKSFEATIAEAEKFAMGEYATALLKGTSMSEDEEAKIARRYAELTGLSEKFVRQCRLRVSDGRFYKELLRDEGKTIGRLDGRLTGTDIDDAGSGPEDDPSGWNGPAFNAMINEYLRNELKLQTDDKYRMWGGGNFPFPEGQYADTSENLRQAMSQNPHLKVLFCCGYYDMACPYFGMQYNVNHMGLRREQLKNLQWTYYQAGHMMYIDKSCREKLKADVDAFILGKK